MQREQALAAFAAEASKLVDFLSVPGAIRPILSFDLKQLVDPGRLAALEQSFQEVVLLNDTFRELSGLKQA